MKNRDFLSLLEKEAKYQSRLEKKRFIPKRLSGLSDFVAQHVWQTCLILSGILALLQAFNKKGGL